MNDLPETPARPCRFCRVPLRATFVDLGMSPLCESFLPASKLDAMEPFFPLHVQVCGECFLVQLPEYVAPEDIFREYAYFSSYSTAWLEHAALYTEQIVQRLKLDSQSLVIELASNDGYLLRNFVERGIPALGIEPAANVARAAIEQGVDTRVEFFGEEYARQLVAEDRRADLVIGNNVLAQVPDLNSFVAGIKLILKPDGVVTLEFPHLMRLIAENQFDTIYHEHFSYFSLLTVERIFGAHGLAVFDVEELWTHGGSLRVYGRHAERKEPPTSPRLVELRAREAEAGFAELATYCDFGTKVERTKRRLLSFLIAAREEGKQVAGYGAPGKGNTLLNYCGIRTDLLAYTVDRNPYKHGKFLPGTHIPIFPPEKIEKTQPDYVLILPWNLKDEIAAQLAHIADWGGRCVIPIPEVAVLEPGGGPA